MYSIHMAVTPADIGFATVPQINMDTARTEGKPADLFIVVIQSISKNEKIGRAFHPFKSDNRPFTPI